MHDAAAHNCSTEFDCVVLPGMQALLVVKAETQQDDAQEDRTPNKQRTSSDTPETDVDELAQYEAEMAAVLDAEVYQKQTLREMSGMTSMLRILRIHSWLASMLSISSST